jgi:hypothetical protein
LSPAEHKNLGRLISVYPISPAHMQRAVLLAVLSFVFFMTMMFAYYLLQKPLFFLLATAFLVIYLFTMYSFLSGRKKTVEVFENGLRMGKTSTLWIGVANVSDKGVLDIDGDKKIEIPQSIYEREALIALIRSNVK